MWGGGCLCLCLCVCVFVCSLMLKGFNVNFRSWHPAPIQPQPGCPSYGWLGLTHLCGGGWEREVAGSWVEYSNPVQEQSKDPGSGMEGRDQKVRSSSSEQQEEKAGQEVRKLFFFLPSWVKQLEANWNQAGGDGAREFIKREGATSSQRGWKELSSHKVREKARVSQSRDIRGSGCQNPFPSRFWDCNKGLLLTPVSSVETTECRKRILVTGNSHSK